MFIVFKIRAEGAAKIKQSCHRWHELPAYHLTCSNRFCVCRVTKTVDSDSTEAKHATKVEETRKTETKAAVKPTGFGG